MDFKYYCGVERSKCNKNFKLNGYPPCCLHCKYNCCNCVVKGNEGIFICYSKVDFNDINLEKETLDL